MKTVRANEKTNKQRLSGRGPGFQTVSGEIIYYLDPDTSSINIYDIAIGLSNQCRYNGQLPNFYSVAQHSVIVAELAEKSGESAKMCLKALLHDSHEAYLGDIVTPLKVILGNYQEIENNIDDKICEKFGIIRGMPEWLHALDKIALATEIRDLRPQGLVPHKSAEPLKNPIEGYTIIPMMPTEAALLFLKKYLEYTNQ